MTTGTDFHVGIVGLAQWEWALRVHVRAGLSHRADLNRKRAPVFSLKGFVGLPPARGSSPASWMRLSHSFVNAARSQAGVIR